MNPRIKGLKPNPDFTLTLFFTNDEIRLFDIKLYLARRIFNELKDLTLFNSVRNYPGSIQWAGGQDLCPDTLYEDRIPCDPSSAS